MLYTVGTLFVLHHLFALWPIYYGKDCCVYTVLTLQLWNYLELILYALITLQRCVVIEDFFLFSFGGKFPQTNEDRGVCLPPKKTPTKCHNTFFWNAHQTAVYKVTNTQQIETSYISYQSKYMTNLPPFGLLVKGINCQLTRFRIRLVF